MSNMRRISGSLVASSRCWSVMGAGLGRPTSSGSGSLLVLLSPSPLSAVGHTRLPHSPQLVLPSQGLGGLSGHPAKDGAVDPSQHTAVVTSGGLSGQDDVRGMRDPSQHIFLLQAGGVPNQPAGHGVTTGHTRLPHSPQLVLPSQGLVGHPCWTVDWLPSQQVIPVLGGASGGTQLG